MRSDLTLGADLSADQLKRIDGICDRFEADWRGNRFPDLAAYLSDAPPEARAALFANSFGSILISVASVVRNPTPWGTVSDFRTWRASSTPPSRLSALHAQHRRVALISPNDRRSLHQAGSVSSWKRRHGTSLRSLSHMSSPPMGTRPWKSWVEGEWALSTRLGRPPSIETSRSR